MEVAELLAGLGASKKPKPSIAPPSFAVERVGGKMMLVPRIAPMLVRCRGFL